MIVWLFVLSFSTLIRCGTSNTIKYSFIHSFTHWLLPSLCEQGQDDLRQDAVMQQVFSMCSMLLQRNADTRKRKLNIRRYKVAFVLKRIINQERVALMLSSFDLFINSLVLFFEKKKIILKHQSRYLELTFHASSRWCPSLSVAACWSGALAQCPSGSF